MHNYLHLLDDILTNGHRRDDRTGTGTISVFARHLRFDLEDGFPVVTTKRVHLHSVIHELLWFLRGETNIGSLQDAGVTIWDEWADHDGEIGPAYGKQWRSWSCPDGSTVDQIATVLQDLRIDPTSRRHIVSAWNVSDLPYMALPPCHLLFQLYVDRGRLSCQVYQRSADAFLGLPFNISSYALLTHIIAHVVGLLPGELILTLGDTHLYRNHIDQARLQLARTPRPLPRLRIARTIHSIDAFRAEDLLIEGYDPHPHIPASVSV